jgi:polysaccharide biosynthesis transport protein
VLLGGIWRGGAAAVQTMIVPSVDYANRVQAGTSGYLEIGARHKVVIAIPIAASVAIAYLFASSLPSQYTAEAMLALDARKVQVIQIDSVVSRLPQEEAVLRTELDALSSRSMAARVAERLDLVHDPDFLKELRAPASSWQRLVEILKASTQALLATGAVHAKPDPVIATPVSQFTVVNWLLGGLGASNDGRSFTIRVSFVSQSAELSARVANAFAEAYLAEQVDLQVTGTQTATRWLSRRLAEMRRELEASEAAVQRFRREADLLEVSGTTMAAEQLSHLNSQLISARKTRYQLEARLQSVSELAREGRNADPLSEILTSPTIQALRMEIAQLTAAAGPLQDDLGPRHPKRIALESQLASLHRQLAAEVEHARRSLENELISARNEEAHLKALLRTDKGQFGEGGAAVVRLNQLQREAEANRALYESLLNRYKQTVEQEGLATPEARLLSQAVPPGAPSGPRKMPILLLGFAAGAGIGAALAFGLEWRDRSVRRIAEIEEMSGVSVFGVLPSLRRVRAGPQELILDSPRGPFSEALRRALVAFQLSHSAAGAKVIMVTSATAGEGKTVFCVAAARALALTGVRVLVIDADLHRPRVAATFGGEASVHLGDVIRGRVALEEAVKKDARSSAQFLAATPGDPQILLDSVGFATLLDRARVRYDLMIVDTPPLLAATDAAAIGTWADVNLFLVRWGKTPRTVVLAALRFFSLCRIAVDGIIMTQVNLRRLAKYDDVLESIPYRSASYRRGSTAPGQSLPARFSGARFEQRERESR